METWNCVNLLVIFLHFYCCIQATIRSSGNGGEQPNSFEAAFQGKCGHGSPCEQSCSELHDGTFECDCQRGFILHSDGYSCYEINRTIDQKTPEDESSAVRGDDKSNATMFRDILYQGESVFETITEEVANDTDILQVNETLEDKLPASTIINTSANQDVDNATKEEVQFAQKKLSTDDNHSYLNCTLNCGSNGFCTRRETPSEDKSGADFVCLCRLGRSGIHCEKRAEVSIPHFSGWNSWLAFPTLRGAYKHVHISVEFKPEHHNGIILLASERDDMAGDFMALILHQGFVEFRYECGSGIGVVRSEDTILLNEWNYITVYRHRWDAWLQLNGGKHILGRSKGLFARVTLREPLFLGGSGNTTGLHEKLHTIEGFSGCVRHLEINDHVYRLRFAHDGDVLHENGVGECGGVNCASSTYPCQEKCDPEDASRCVCPLGRTGQKCDLPVDLQVPAFNGSSFLRYRSLGDQVLSYLDLELIVKPDAPNGLILCSGQHCVGGQNCGDFIAVYLLEAHLYFAYNLGSGTTTVSSLQRLSLGEWHQVRISRTGRLAILYVDDQAPVETLSPGAFTQLSLPLNLYVGGLPTAQPITVRLSAGPLPSFIGCLQTVRINGRDLAIVDEALGGANIQHCAHPCAAQPCGPDGLCVPKFDYFVCRGPPAFHAINSFLQLTDTPTLRAISSTQNQLHINIRFRLVAIADGLLLFLRFDANNDLSLGVRNGALCLQINSEDRQIVIVHNSSVLHDNGWHRVKAIRDGLSGQLGVDNAPSVTAQMVSFGRRRSQWAEQQPSAVSVFIGGMFNYEIFGATGYLRGVAGCIADLVFNMDYRVNLINNSAIRHNVGECSSS